MTLVCEPLTRTTKTPPRYLSGAVRVLWHINKDKLPKCLNFIYLFLMSRMLKWLIISGISSFANTTLVSKLFWSCVHIYKSALKWPNFISLTNLWKSMGVVSSRSWTEGFMSNVKPYQTFKATCEPLTLGN